MSAADAPDPIAPQASGDLDSPRRELMIGGGVIAAFFVLFLGWAALAPLDAGAFAPGQVEVSGNRQAVQHREGGVVSALNVAEGDRVREGQVLVELATGNLQATERGLAAQVLSLEAQRARIIAERDGLAGLARPAAFAELSLEDQALADEAFRTQQQQFAARRASRTTEAGVLRQRIGQLREQQLGFERQIAANQEQQRLLAEELEGMRSLAAQGYAPENRVRALERTAAALDGELGSLRAQVARTAEQIGETELQISGVSTRLGEEVADQLKLVEVQINELTPRWLDVRQQIERGQIRSPVDGQVVGLTAFTVGGVIQPGQTLMEVVPESAAQVIVARINPEDIDNVRVGLRTEVRFPSLRDRDPPLVYGEVTRISADTFEDERSGQRHYRAQIVVPPEELERLGRAADDIRAGMPVEVVVLLRQRSALTYLIEPLTRSLWRSGSLQ
ncbi:secretion protein HylD [Brevundimonas sp. AAP58]|uniref:HlyD family type I secretion periplasmic adaptor subunit n=1 Tax=Brevundimonas sp. AAP58 TaxID=1523422 RepID=UPI0006B98757|nr:HlyD family type I secretion periplasmic adaptor subunit [Brevundimonas sp. AAP58]KPF81863.1 secretion protein HylD [Brevundimonas sp. AAP58]